MMTLKNIFTILMNNKERIVVVTFFFGMLALNVLVVLAALFNMFNYDGGTEDVKLYYEIRSVEMAHDVFFKHIIGCFVYGVLFAFPLIWSLYHRKINLNGVLVQLLPLLISLGYGILG